MRNYNASVEMKIHFIVMLLMLLLWSSYTTNAFVEIIITPSHTLSRQQLPQKEKAINRARLFKRKNSNNGKYFMSQQSNQDEPPVTATTTTTDNNNNNLMNLSPTEYILATEQMDPSTKAVVDAARKKQQLLVNNNGDDNDNSATKYPIDLPSPLLLATSMILAIISTGSLFQLFDVTGVNANNPAEAAAVAASASSSSSSSLGVLPTIALVLIGAPTSIYLLYAAITKATAETEADDQAFLSGK